MVSQPKETHNRTLYKAFSSLGKISAILAHILKYSHEILFSISQKGRYLSQNFVEERSTFLL